jgi:hypothetical protein
MIILASQLCDDGDEFNAAIALACRYVCLFNCRLSKRAIIISLWSGTAREKFEKTHISGNYFTYFAHNTSSVHLAVKYSGTLAPLVGTLPDWDIDLYFFRVDKQ